MARQTRAQRRARRTEPAMAGGPPVPPARRTANGGSQPEPARSDPRSGRRGGFLGFIQESWGELKKVEWPRQNQLIQGVIVVLVACIVVGVFLYGADLVFKPLVQKVFLR